MNLKRTFGENPLEIFLNNTLFTMKWQKHRCIQQGIGFVYVKVTHVLENHYYNEKHYYKTWTLLTHSFSSHRKISPCYKRRRPKFKGEFGKVFALAIFWREHTPRHCCDICTEAHLYTSFNKTYYKHNSFVFFEMWARLH